MDLGRALSLLIGLGYLAAVAVAAGPAAVLPYAGPLVFVLALIWYGDEMGSYTGFLPPHRPITQRSPGSVVRLLGWCFLLTPAVIAFFNWVRPN